MTLAHLDGNKNKNSIFAPITPFFLAKLFCQLTVVAAKSSRCEKMTAFVQFHSIQKTAKKPM